MLSVGLIGSYPNIEVFRRTNVPMRSQSMSAYYQIFNVVRVERE